VSPGETTNIDFNFNSTSQTPTIYANVTFDQVGAGSDFNGTVLTVNGTGYSVGDLPQTFSGAAGSSLSFAYFSGLTPSSGAAPYAWEFTTGTKMEQ
jgi:hypothetical protein